MDTKPFTAEKLYDTFGTQKEHESEEENRKHNHVQELRNKLPENRRNLGHIVVTILVWQNYKIYFLVPNIEF